MDLWQDEFKKVNERKINRERFQNLLKNSPADLPISSFSEFLKTEDHLLLASVIRFLGSYRKKSIFPTIIPFADHPVSSVRSAVCYSIGAICDKRGSLILMKKVKDPDAQVAWEAYVGLSKIHYKESLQIFIDGLSNSNAVLQMLCARTLGKIPDIRSLQKLHQMVSNPVPSVRQAVIETLGKINHSSSIPFMVTATSDSIPEVKCAALLGLSHFPQSENAYIFSKAAGDISDNVRLIAVQALEVIGTRECSKILVKLSTDRNYMVRSSSIKALGKIGFFEQLPAISRGAGDSNWRVRQSVAMALGNLGYSESLPVLLKLLKDKDYRVRNSAASGIWIIDENDMIDPNIAKELLNININMMETGDLLTRREGVRNFAGQGIKQAIPIVSQAIKDADSEIRRYAAVALGKTRDKKAYETLHRLMNDPEISVRWEMIEQFDLFNRNLTEVQNLKLLKDPSASIRLRSFMNLSQKPSQKSLNEISRHISDPNPLVRWGCTFALTQGNFSNIETPLKIAVNDSNPYISFLAAIKLSEMRVEDAGPVLLNCLNDSNDYIREEAARGLLLIKISRHGKKILSHMEDSSLKVRHRLSACLIYSADIFTLPGMVKYLENPDPVVRANIIKALGEKLNAESQKHLSNALTDSNLTVRTAALEAIAKFKKESAIEEIRKFAKVSDTQTKIAIAQTLGKIKPQGAQTILFEMVEKEKNPEVIFQAMYELGEFKLEAVKQFLISYLNHPSKLKRKTASGSLKKIGVKFIHRYFYKFQKHKIRI